MSGHALYRMRVVHRRRFPVQYRFSYPVFSLLLDVDAIDALAARSVIFSRNRFNVVSFYDSDHGDRGGGELRPWLAEVLRAAGVGSANGRILLLAMPRVFGYVFNPLSVFYCFDELGGLRAIVCEVKNTFGEQHCYVLHADDGVMAFPVRASRVKEFYVSPFMATDGRYEFRFSAPKDSLSIGIKHINGSGVQLVAVQRGDAEPLTTPNLLKALCRTPLVTFKVTLMIHWQALRLWSKKVPRYRHVPVEQGPGGYLR